MDNYKKIELGMCVSLETIKINNGITRILKNKLPTEERLQTW